MKQSSQAGDQKSRSILVIVGGGGGLVVNPGKLSSFQLNLFNLKVVQGPPESEHQPMVYPSRILIMYLVYNVEVPHQ
jgi:hypothetical protein